MCWKSPCNDKVTWKWNRAEGDDPAYFPRKVASQELASCSYISPTVGGSSHKCMTWVATYFTTTGNIMLVATCKESPGNVKIYSIREFKVETQIPTLL
jgi:hypothetical protein